METNRTKRDLENRKSSGPTSYELIDKDGRSVPVEFHTAGEAAMYAAKRWPDEEQDEERSGKGWDVQVVGCDRPAVKTR